MEEPKELLLKLIRERSVVKQDVYDQTLKAFEDFKEVLKDCVDEISDAFGEADHRVEFYYKDKGTFEAEVKIAGDVLIFHMHTNVFQFDRSNSLWRSSYLQDDELNGYVGMINVYNFLADSFKYQRLYDRGYMIARMFVNREGHFMVQGKRQLGYLFNDFLNSKVSREELKRIAHAAFIYTIGFDLYTPPFQEGQEVTLQQIQAMSSHLQIATGKRLGFKFSHEDDFDA
jgi:hypothetical protein